MSTKNIWTHIHDLADPEFLVSDSIELLLGADIYGELALPGLRHGEPAEPIAQILG